MTDQPRRNLFFSGAVLLVVFLALLPWWRNHGYLRDLFDYGLVLAANGHLDRGERPYVDFTTPIQAGFLGLNWAIERLGGGTYAALTRGGAGLILLSAVLLPLMLVRRWPGWAALLVGGAVTVASASQHTILWHNSLGVLCLALVGWSAACAPVLRRADWPWHVLMGAGLLLGGINKLNFHLVAVAAALAWALRAGLLRRAGWGPVCLTLFTVLLLGLGLPLTAELAWTGASLKLWLANVVQLAAGYRLDALRKTLAVDFLFNPIHDYYGPQLLHQVGLFGGWVSLLTLAGCWPADKAARWDRGLVPAAVLVITAAGAALLATNFEIGCLGLAAWLVLAVSLWLGFAPENRRALFLGGVIAPAMLLGVGGGWTAWVGQRSQFGYAKAPQKEYVEAASLSPTYARLAGLRLPPDVALSLELLESVLPAKDLDGKYPVHFAAGLEFADRFFPSLWEKGQPLWMHWATTYGPAETARYKEKLLRKDYYQAVFCTVPFDYWPVPVRDLLQEHYIKDLTGPAFRRWVRRDEDSVDLRDSLESVRELGGNVDGRVLHLHRQPLGGWRTADGRKLLGTTRRAGEILVQTPVYRMRGVAVVERQPGAGDGPLSAECKVIVHGASPEDVRWFAPVNLAAGQKSLTVPFEADGAGKQLLLWVNQPAGQEGKLLVGYRELEITHAAEAPGGAPQLQDENLADLPVTPEMARGFFAELPWRPQQFVTRGGRAATSGLELPPWGELWLRTPVMAGVINGRLEATGSATRPTMVRVLWYKGGRLQILQQLWVARDQPVDFHAWTAEPGGWIGLVVERGAGASPVVARVTDTTLAP